MIVADPGSTRIDVGSAARAGTTPSRSASAGLWLGSPTIGIVTLVVVVDVVGSATVVGGGEVVEEEVVAIGVAVDDALLTAWPHPVNAMHATMTAAR
ncbi:MAG: hypothetical protein JJE47_17975 [Acidimicrobiia bacterium]|nr:hypothetical protein [Acidimicrobiia bacterium]